MNGEPMTMVNRTRLSKSKRKFFEDLDKIVKALKDRIPVKPEILRNISETKNVNNMTIIALNQNDFFPNLIF